MTAALGAGLFAYVSQIPECGSRVYPQVLPQNVALPAVTWQMVSGPIPVASHSDRHETPTPVGNRFIRARVQLSCWGRTQEEAESLGDAVYAAMEGAAGTWGVLPVGSCHVVLWLDDRDEKRNLFRRLIDVMIQYTLTAGS